MIQTGPDVDSAQLIPAASENGEQPSPNSSTAAPAEDNALGTNTHLNNTMITDVLLQTTD